MTLPSSMYVENSVNILLKLSAAGRGPIWNGLTSMSKRHVALTLIPNYWDHKREYYWKILWPSTWDLVLVLSCPHEPTIPSPEVQFHWPWRSHQPRISKLDSVRSEAAAPILINLFLSMENFQYFCVVHDEAMRHWRLGVLRNVTIRNLQCCFGCVWVKHL